MRLRNILTIIIVLLVVLLGLLIFNVFIDVSNVNENNNKIGINGDEFKTVNLGSNVRGTVELIGPLGNRNSNVKIAYIIGVHPLESTVHNALYDSLIAKTDSLNYCYYIYKVNVKDNPDHYDIGRMNGQLLAQEFVVPDATSKGYDLVIDIHSNQGTNGGNYEETNFIFTPLNNPTSQSLSQVLNMLLYQSLSQEFLQ